MARPKVLIVEDERSLTEVLQYNLEKEGYDVVTASDGKEALRKAQTALPDLVLLDLMLPQLSGLEVCKELRAGTKTARIPILMLTAKAEETDQVVGFAVGADDYVTKPFSVKVLLQRVKVLLRRGASAEPTPDVLQSGPLKLDKRSHRVTLKGESLPLTPTEFRLLETLMRQPGRAFSRQDLMESAIGDGAIVLERTIDVHIKSLRRKLEQVGDWIETVRGVGYRFQEP
ncbi:MAG TPA: response regulator transcription factor [Gemmatales bacterium]|nr:response regulator transcription factor [Gemmatales bacterium]HMP61333.1 response regulator transcription factor [Gemmatales bacterium]